MPEPSNSSMTPMSTNWTPAFKEQKLAEKPLRSFRQFDIIEKIV